MWWAKAEHHVRVYIDLHATQNRTYVVWFSYETCVHICIYIYTNTHQLVGIYSCWLEIVWLCSYELSCEDYIPYCENQRTDITYGAAFRNYHVQEIIYAEDVSCRPQCADMHSHFGNIHNTSPCMCDVCTFFCLFVRGCV